MAPDISVIMAARNSEHTLQRAIDSILLQSYENFEFVIVNDASSDRTQEILSSYASADPRVKLLTNASRQGLAASLNFALQHSQGAFLARMDADDCSYRNRFQKQVEFLRAHPEVSVLGTGAELVNASGEKIGTTIKAINHEDLIKDIWHVNPFIHPTVMFRRFFYEDIGGYNPRLLGAEDFDLWLRAHRRHRFHNIPEVLFSYTVARTTKWRDVKWTSVVQMQALRTHGWSLKRFAQVGRFFLVATSGAIGLRQPRLR